MFELADRLIGIFKTNDITKCLSIEQKNLNQNEDKNKNISSKKHV